MNIKQTWKKIWHFIWEEDSIASWIVNVVLAFIIVKFILYPLLGLLLGTQFPVVAVVSGSMQHNGENFEEWWNSPQNTFYREIGIEEREFEQYKFKNGFNKGDLMILRGAKDVERGDVIVFRTQEKNPVIHRVVVVNEDSYQTKGDNYQTNRNSRQDELAIQENKILGKASIRIPLLGWFKIGFVSILKAVGINAF